MTTMTTDDEDRSIRATQTALLRRCHNTLSAFSEREFERNTGHTYVPGCTPPSLANRAEPYVRPNPSKRAYREATHLGGQGIILAQPPTAALERAYVDQPTCARSMVPGDSDGGCAAEPRWGRVRKRSTPAGAADLALDYADEPTIKCETPTEDSPTRAPRLPDPTDNGPGALQNAVAETIERSTRRSAATASASKRATRLVGVGVVAALCFVGIVAAVAWRFRRGRRRV